MLALLPDYERQGIGKALNTRAYGFYRALGWRPTGETDAHGDEVLVLSQPMR